MVEFGADILFLTPTRKIVMVAWSSCQRPSIRGEHETRNRRGVTLNLLKLVHNLQRVYVIEAIYM